IPLSEVIANEDLAIGTFRRSISHILPEMTRVALLAREKELVAETPNFNARKFRYYLSRADYQREWGKGYRRPGFGTRVLAFFLRIIPKVGPAVALDFKVPTTKTEDMYIKSVDQTIDDYRRLLRQVSENNLKFPDTDCDTGRETAPAEYSLADDTYARLLDELSEGKFAQINPELQQNILIFYSNARPPIQTKKKKQSWAKTEEEVKALKAWAPAA